MGSALHWFTKSTICRRLSLTLFTLTLFLSTPVVADSDHPEQVMTPRSSVLIPLYIYPVKGAWDPLFQAVQSHPSLDFTVVINPASGPGATILPDANYTREVTRLNAFPNVRLVGYVAVDYGKKPIDQALAEIKHYSEWPDNNPFMAMQGIFLDESPQIADDFNTTYLAKIRDRIKSTKGLSTGTIVMNPGMIPDSRILAIADKTVVFEEQYQTYVNRQAAKSLAALPDRNALCCLMHSVPSQMPGNQLQALVNELRELAGSVFLTDLSEMYYQQFSSRFLQYIDSVKQAK